MKTYRVGKLCDPSKLHDELRMAGVPCLTVRASQETMKHAAHAAVIVTEDDADDATVEGIVAAHTHGKTVPATLATETTIKALEDGRGKGWLFVGSREILPDPASENPQ